MKPEWELLESQPITSLEEPVKRIFDLLDGLNFNADGQPIVLKFSPKAQELFNDWQTKHENRLRTSALPPHMESHLAKYKKLLPALCLILDHLECADKEIIPTEISETTIIACFEWLHYFESHSERIYASGTNSVPKTARDLIERIRQGEIKEPFTTRDVYYKRHWRGLFKAEEVEEILEYLMEKNYLTGTLTRTGGRPTTKYWVNPKVFET